MKLYNSLTQQKEEFTPREENKVSIYVCGITPYDTTHLGHAFTYIQFDVLIRYLSHKGFDVTYTQNVTDIDNDILRKAKEENRDWKELGDFWTKKFLNDLKSLNIAYPTHYVKATDSIPKIIEMIKILLDKGNAYEKNGVIYFDVSTFTDYGKLSKFTQKQMIQIARERGGSPDNTDQKNPLDFVLWQKSKEDEPFWENPWSSDGGRPGWHIECSAMINQYLGNQIDIHGGGRDLIFPHHESEIAQSESYTNKSPYVKYWVHTAMLQYQSEKMAKSLGNLVMVSDLLKKFSPNAIRYLLLSHHYRSPWDFHEEDLNSAQKETDLYANLLKTHKNNENIKKDLLVEFYANLDDDLDTLKALQTIKKIREKAESETDNEKKEQMLQAMYKMLQILGFTY